MAVSVIRLCLAKNVLANVHGISMANELLKKLEELYLKEQCYILKVQKSQIT